MAPAKNEGQSREVSLTVVKAAMRADAMLEKGDLDGLAVWKRVRRAIDDLLNTTPGADQAVN